MITIRNKIFICIALLFCISNFLYSQSSAYFPFNVDSEEKKIFTAKDTTLDVYDFILVDSVLKKSLFDNSNFVTQIRKNGNVMRFNVCLKNGKSELIHVSTDYLILHENCYEFIRIFDNSTIHLKSISEIKKLDEESQVRELFLGVLYSCDENYRNEFLNLPNNALKNNSISSYPFLRSYIENLGLIKRVEGSKYSSTGKTINSIHFESCKN